MPFLHSSVVGLCTTLICLTSGQVTQAQQMPVVISTWPFVEAVRVAWQAIEGGASAVDAVVEGCSTCEELQCDGSVGYGGSPDENGETTLDAMVMDGTTMKVGAVAALRFVKEATRAAKLVLQHTGHTLLVGDQASDFAISLGLRGPVDLRTDDSIRKWVGDGPIAGAGAYADGDVGACGATGDGDIMMRFLPCYQVVESMRQGMSPKEAAVDAIARIKAKFPYFVGAVFALNRNGSHAGACNGWTFQYSVRDDDMDDVQVVTVQPDVLLRL